MQLEEARHQAVSGQEILNEAPLRPLVEVLREAKEKKEEDFQAQWRQMKQGIPSSLLLSSSCSLTKALMQLDSFSNALFPVRKLGWLQDCLY